MFRKITANTFRDRSVRTLERQSQLVVVVYHETIVAIGHGLSNKFWPFGTRLHSTHCREFNYLKLCRPAYFISTTQLLPHPGHE